MAPLDSVLQLAVLLLQAIWGLFLVVLGFAIRRVLKDLETNTKETRDISKELHTLNLGLLANFVTKEEWLRLAERIRLMEGYYAAMKAREELRDQMHRKGD